MKVDLQDFACLTLVVFFLVTACAGIHEHNDNAASVVNGGCAKHSGVAAWGGDKSYSATCKDGFAFIGSSGRTVTWRWPW